MSGIIRPNAGLLFMKVGLHAGETYEQIIERKRREYETAGMVFWGYGGGTCHPSRCVQPFAKMKVEAGEQIMIIMEEIDSRHPPTPLVATQYSEDGIDWKPIPRGIEVRGSRYAVVLGEIKDSDLEIDLSEYQVAAGPSTGKQATKYILGRVDKACLEKADSRPKNVEPQIKRIRHLADMQAPYAVFTR